MIVIKDLCKQYDGKPILQNFCCAWEETDTICLMGKSGQGKTTLLRILAGLEQADSGSICGIQEKKVSMVFQENRLLSGFSVWENLCCVCHTKAQKDKILPMLEKMGLSAWVHQPVELLSGGMQRRIAIARALLVDFDILLLDEPFQGLDTQTRQTMMDMIQTLTKNKFVCMSTHHAQEVTEIDGKMIEISKT